MKTEQKRIAILETENRSLRIIVDSQRELIQQLHSDIDVLTEILEELNWHILVQDEGNEIPFNWIN